MEKRKIEEINCAPPLIIKCHKADQFPQGWAPICLWQEYYGWKESLYKEAGLQPLVSSWGP